MMVNNRNLPHKLAGCIHACNNCMSSCLREEDIKMMVSCIELDRECAAICSTTLNSLHQGARFTHDLLQLCVKACKACADECKKHPMNHCQECARACEACSEECEAFLQR